MLVLNHLPFASRSPSPPHSIAWMYLLTVACLPTCPPCSACFPHMITEGKRWKHVKLVGSDLDLRTVSWKLPADVIPTRSTSTSTLESDDLLASAQTQTPHPSGSFQNPLHGGSFENSVQGGHFKNLPQGEDLNMSPARPHASIPLPLLPLCCHAIQSMWNLFWTASFSQNAAAMLRVGVRWNTVWTTFCDPKLVRMRMQTMTVMAYTWENLLILSIVVQTLLILPLLLEKGGSSSLLQYGNCLFHMTERKVKVSVQQFWSLIPTQG